MLLCDAVFQFIIIIIIRQSLHSFNCPLTIFFRSSVDVVNTPLILILISIHGFCKAHTRTNTHMQSLLGNAEESIQLQTQVPRTDGVVVVPSTSAVPPHVVLLHLHKQDFF